MNGKYFVVCVIFMLAGITLDHWSTHLKLSREPRQILTWQGNDGSYGYVVQSPAQFERLSITNLGDWAIQDFLIASGFILLTFLMGFLLNGVLPGTDGFALLIPIIIGLIRIVFSLINFGIYLAW